MTQTPEALRQIQYRLNHTNNGEDEFLQAVGEVMSSLGPLVAKQPELLRDRLIERVCEPEWQIIFRVPWVLIHA